MTVLARKIGKQVIPVVEKFTELESIVRHSQELNVRPVIGVRVKLASRGAGRWKSSAGFRSKFGLTLTEVLEAFEYLKQRDMADCLQLLHFHLGSQITNIRNIKAALTEAARIYVEMARVGAGVKYLDVGGGLGVDYDGSQSDFVSSVNYTLQEYANDVVFRIKNVCDEADVPHPTIISESGRAMVAYHSVLVFDVLGVSNFDRYQAPAEIPDDAPQPITDLFGIHRDLSKKNYLESYHDALQALDEAMSLFNLGHLTIEHRAMAERLFWALCNKLLNLVRELDYVPEELQGLEALLSDTYICNLSIFQSMPDSWAIKQLFPIMPIHRLDEPPVRRGVLGDITCDSDGKVDQFIDLRDVAQHPGTAPLRRPALLPRGVPARRLPGDPRRPAQPLRRHQRRPRQPRRERRDRALRRSSRGTPSARSCTTCSTPPTSCSPACGRTSSAPSASARSRWKTPASCSTSTSRGWKAIPTWNDRPVADAEKGSGAGVSAPDPFLFNVWHKPCNPVPPKVSHFEANSQGSSPWPNPFKDKLEDAGHKIAETATKVGHQVGEKVEEAADWAKEKGHQVGHRIDEAAQKVEHRTGATLARARARPAPSPTSASTWTSTPRAARRSARSTTSRATRSS